MKDTICLKTRKVFGHVIGVYNEKRIIQKKNSLPKNEDFLSSEVILYTVTFVLWNVK
jgi:hypothetical protein